MRCCRRSLHLPAAAGLACTPLCGDCFDMLLCGERRAGAGERRSKRSPAAGLQASCAGLVACPARDSGDPQLFRHQGPGASSGDAGCVLAAGRPGAELLLARRRHPAAQPHQGAPRAPSTWLGRARAPPPPRTWAELPAVWGPFGASPGPGTARTRAVLGAPGRRRARHARRERARRRGAPPHPALRPARGGGARRSSASGRSARCWRR